jgi:hypothetical protein
MEAVAALTPNISLNKKVMYTSGIHIPTHFTSVIENVFSTTSEGVQYHDTLL